MWPELKDGFDFQRHFNEALSQAIELLKVSKLAPDYQSGEWKQPVQRGNLLSLPLVVLGQLWPCDRAVIGRRVCRMLHQELSANMPYVSWSMSSDGYLCMDTMMRDIRRLRNLRHTNFQLRFRPPMRPGMRNSCAILIRSALVTHVALGIRSLHLYATDFKFGLWDLGALLRQCTNLIDLNLSFNDLEDRGAAWIAAGLQGITSLKRIDLRETRMSALGMAKLAEVFATVEELDLSDNELRRTACKNLADALMVSRKITHLTLARCGLDSDGVSELAGALHDCRRLCHLDLRKNQIGPSGIAALSSALRDKQLTSVDLSRTSFLCEPNERGPFLATLLSSSSSLTHLSLWDCGIVDSVVCPLAEGLGRSSRLLHLDLSHNDLTDEGGEALALHLPKCTALTHLDLSRNWMGASVARLHEALAPCTRLTHLDLQDRW